MDAKASPQGTVHKTTWSTQALIGELSPKKGVEWVSPDLVESKLSGNR